MSDTLRFAGIYPLSAVSDKQLSGFDCGKISLNSWLEQKTRSNEVACGSRTYVLLSLDGEVAGFYQHCGFSPVGKSLPFLAIKLH